MADLFTFTVKSQPEIREDILRTTRYMLIRRGVANPNVGPDSDYFVIATGVANEIAVGQANGVIAVDDQMPDTASDDADAGTLALTRIATILGLSKRSPSGSIGFCILDATAPTAIAVNEELQDGLAQRYRVTTGGTYANADPIPVEAVGAGSGTNLASGTQLRWVRAA